MTAANDPGLKLAKRIANRLLQHYVRLSPDHSDDCLVWISPAHRDTYYLLCSLWHLRREA
jgi:hypothetical protein